MNNFFKNKNIALIGNAKSLFNFRYGTEIDSFDIVCRLNRGVLIKHPESQGTRTDVWGIGVPKFVDDIVDNIIYKKLIHLSFKSRKEIHPKVDFYLPLELVNSLQQKINHTKPSTGLAMLYYLDYCDPKSITLYGFDWKKTPTWYFEENDYQPHDWKLEEKFVRLNFLSKPHIILK